MRIQDQKQTISLDPNPPSDAKKWEPIGYACVCKGIYITGEDSKEWILKFVWELSPNLLETGQETLSQMFYTLEM